MIDKKYENKKAQLSLFVIIGIIIVGAAIAAILVWQNPFQATTSAAENPAENIRSCVDGAIKESLKIILPQGGFFNPEAEEYYDYNDIKVSFLCYAPTEGENCRNIHPVLDSEIAKEIKTYVAPRIKKCYDNMKTELGSYKEEPADFSVSVEIEPQDILVKINKKISIEKAGTTEVFDKFNYRVTSDLYSFIMIANEIVGAETNCDCSRDSCSADTLGLTMANSGFSVEKPVYADDGEEVYSIESAGTLEKYNLAIRNCV